MTADYGEAHTSSEKGKVMRILLYSPDNGVTRNFMPHLWMFLLQALTPPGRLAAMEQRLAAMLQGLDIVQPALAKFYNSLSDEQKAQINRIGPRAA